MPDLNAREWLMLAPVAAAVLWMGVYPESFLAPMRADIQALDARIARLRAACCLASARASSSSAGSSGSRGRPVADDGAHAPVERLAKPRNWHCTTA